MYDSLNLILVESLYKKREKYERTPTTQMMC